MAEKIPPVAPPSRRSRDPVRDDFNEITQLCPGGKVRFDPLIVPELVSWFLYHIDQHEKLRDANQRVFEQTGMEAAAKLAQNADTWIDFLNRMVQHAAHGWKRSEWEGILHMMRLATAAAEKDAAEAPKAEKKRK